MNSIKSFTNLQAWQEAHKLVELIYLITNNFPKVETYGLTSQLRRAAISVTANIAEGFSRYHYKDRVRFYYDSRGSLSEVQSEILDAQKVNLINQTDFQNLWKQSEQVHLVLGGLIRKTISLSQPG